MARLLRKVELARIAGAPPSALTARCKPGGAFADAMVGRLVDADHPAVLAWLHSRLAPEEPEPELPPAPPPRPGAVVKRETPGGRGHYVRDHSVGDAGAFDVADLGVLMDLSLQELTDRYGDPSVVREWVETRAKLAAARKAEISVAATRGQYLDRGLVRSHLIGAVDALTRRLLTDMPRTLAVRLRAAATEEEAEQAAYDLLQQLVAGEKRAFDKHLRKISGVVSDGDPD